MLQLMQGFFLPSHAELPQHRTSEPHVLSWSGPAQYSHHQYLSPHRPQLHAESLRSTWATLQQPGHRAGPGPTGQRPRTDCRCPERTVPATTAAPTADETHQCTWWDQRRQFVFLWSIHVFEITPNMEAVHTPDCPVNVQENQNLMVFSFEGTKFL